MKFGSQKIKSINKFLFLFLNIIIIIIIPEKNYHKALT
jgi:hypothetical protein